MVQTTKQVLCFGVTLLGGGLEAGRSLGSTEL
jgi:hypothetical protein